MEYIIVTVKGRPQEDAAVLINGEHNGRTTELLTLGEPGWVFVSVDLAGAEEQQVDVRNTTPSKPIRVHVPCAES
jgi:hypothetical protein